MTNRRNFVQNSFRVQLRVGEYWRSVTRTYRTLSSARREAEFQTETMGREARVVQVLGGRIRVCPP